MTVMRLRTGLAALAFLALPGCVALQHPTVSIDPGVNFAAHVEHEGIAFDRLPGGGTAVARPPGWFRLGGAPTFVLEQESRRIADLWLTAPATVEVRTASASVSDAVAPGWDDNAIRLTLRRPGEAALQTDVFSRTEPGGGPSTLSRIATQTLDVRGTYRAAVRDAKGAETGWLRVRISPYGESSRIFDGVLPPTVSSGLAAAVAVALDSEIDWIEGHAINSYRGADGEPLRQSVPFGR
jgi:hypothetical protein